MIAHYKRDCGLQMHTAIIISVFLYEYKILLFTITLPAIVHLFRQDEYN